MESFYVRYRNLLVLLALTAGRRSLGWRCRCGAPMPAEHARRGGQCRRAPNPAVGQRSWFPAAEKAVRELQDRVFGIWKNYIDLRHVRQQKQDLQDTVDRLRLEQAALLEDARQGQRLQAMLDFQQKYIYKTIAAQIIGSSGSDQSHVFYLDKGKADGLARDMAVISADGIVGKVREVFPALRAGAGDQRPDQRGGRDP